MSDGVHVPVVVVWRRVAELDHAFVTVNRLSRMGVSVCGASGVLVDLEELPSSELDRPRCVRCTLRAALIAKALPRVDALATDVLKEIARRV